ncbi:MAG: glycosyltransferase [Bacteroidota bacterium]|nr:glycosyltransferase [Bacteroidota bacterium]
MGKKNVLIISLFPLHNGPRIIREIDILKLKYNITAVGASAPHDPTIEYYPLVKYDYSIADKIFRKLYRIITGNLYTGISFYIDRQFQNLINKVKPDYVIIHSPVHLPYFLRSRIRKYKVIFNAHEYHPLEFDENGTWLKLWGKYYYQLYRKFLPRVDLLINVCKSISEKCEAEFGKSSLIIPNASGYQPHLTPSATNAPGPVKIIHHGGANRERKIEIMIEAAQILGQNYQLDLMLTSSHEEYYSDLIKKAEKSSNVKIINPVPFDKIIPIINQYDIGLFNLPPTSYNYKVALPNKLFEFIQARLCIVVSPSIEMAQLVQQYHLGVVSSDYTAAGIADAIKKLSFADIEQYKKNSDMAAFELSAEKYMSEFLKAMETI